MNKNKKKIFNNKSILKLIIICLIDRLDVTITFSFDKSKLIQSVRHLVLFLLWSKKKLDQISRFLINKSSIQPHTVIHTEKIIYKKNNLEK